MLLAWCPLSVLKSWPFLKLGWIHLLVMVSCIFLVILCIVVIVLGVAEVLLCTMLIICPVLSFLVGLLPLALSTCGSLLIPGCSLPLLSLAASIVLQIYLPSQIHYVCNSI